MLSKQYLQEIENSYKNLYLEEANKYSEIAVFKWNNVNSMKDIVNDISKINLDEWDMNEDKFCDWNYYFIEALHENRYDYTNKKSLMLESFNDLGMEDIESLCCEFDDIGHRNEVYESMASILVKLDAIFKLILSFQNFRCQTITSYQLIKQIYSNFYFLGHQKQYKLLTIRVIHFIDC